MESPKTGIIIGAANSVAILGITLYFYQRCSILAEELITLQKELDDIKKKHGESTTGITGKIQEIISHINSQGEYVRNTLKVVDSHGADIKKIQRRMKGVKVNRDSSKDSDSEEDEDQKELKKIQARIAEKKRQSELGKGVKTDSTTLVQAQSQHKKHNTGGDDDDDVSADLNAVKKS